MKNIISYILLILPFLVQGQTGKDTLYMFGTHRSMFSENYLKHNLTSIKNYGEVSLQYSNKRGEGKLAQEAFDNRSIDFYAVGANQLGDFRISGDFLFNKVFDDSLSFGQQNNIDKWSPFNYYASKAGNYERQNYKSNLTLSYSINKTIQPFININYLSHWTTGSVDPRFESKKFEMKYNPGVILNFDKFNFGVKGIFGTGRENLGVSYKNKEFSTSLLFPERVHFLNLGYGYTSIKDTVNTRKYTNIKGAEVTFHSDLGANTLDVTATFERKNDNNTNDLKSTKVYQTRGKYTEELFDAQAVFSLYKTFSSNLFLLKASFVRGFDGLINFSPTLDKVNYSIENKGVEVEYMHASLRDKKWNWNVGVASKYTSIDRSDYASNLHVSNSFIEIAPVVQLRNQLAEGDFLQLTFKPTIQVATNSDILYSENSLNSYIRNVVFWDYDFYKTNSAKFDIGVNWFTKRLSDQYLLGIKADYSYLKNVGNTKETIYINGPSPWNRNRYSLTVSLYL